jgi:hypothetical protein
LFETDLSTADSFKLSHPCHASHALGAEVPAESDVLPRPPKFTTFYVRLILRWPLLDTSDGPSDTSKTVYSPGQYALSSLGRLCPAKTSFVTCRVGTLGRGLAPFVSCQTSKKMSHMDASFFLPPVGFRHRSERHRCRLSSQVRLQVGRDLGPFSHQKPSFGFSMSFLNGPNAHPLTNHVASVTNLDLTSSGTSSKSNTATDVESDVATTFCQMLELSDRIVSRLTVL